jgi:hypothetical protein
MTTTRWILVSLIVILGGLLAARLALRRDRGSFVRYYSPELGVSFEYPAGWKVSVIPPGRPGLRELQIFGPRREDLEYSLYLHVMTRRLPEAAQGPGVVETVAQDGLKEQQKLPGFHLTAEGPTRCGRLRGILRRVSYELNLPTYTIHSSPIPMQELTAYGAHGERAFQISYAATAKDFSVYEAAFQRLLASFALR